VKRWDWKAEEMVSWSSWMRLSVRLRRERSVEEKGARVSSVSIRAVVESRWPRLEEGSVEVSHVVGGQLRLRIWVKGDEGKMGRHTPL
jgi:hypothetical protein